MRLAWIVGRKPFNNTKLWQTFVSACAEDEDGNFVNIDY